MKKRQAMTAADLMAELQSDTRYQQEARRREQAQQARQRVLVESLTPCVTALNALGLPGDSLQEITGSSAPLGEDAVAILLESLGGVPEPRAQESIVRALAASGVAFDGRALARCFESTDDPGLRWAIANTIALTHPHSIHDWLSELREAPYWEKTLRELGQ